MSQARGRKSQLLYDVETEFGTDPAVVAAILMPFNTMGVKASQTLTEDNTIRNRRDPAMPSRGNVDVAGDIVVPVDQIAFGYWLRAMLGVPETSGEAPGPYTHTFKLGDTQPSLVLERGFTDIGVYEKLNGCKVSRLSITFGGDGELTATITIMGAKQTVGNTAYDDTPTDITLTKFHQFQAGIKEGGTTIATVTQATLEIDLDLDGDQYPIGSAGERADIPEGIAGISGAITALFKDKTLLEKAISGAESSLEIKLTDKTNSLTISLPEIMYERTSPVVEGPRGVRLEANYRAYYQDSTEKSSIVATLVNTHAAYGAEE